MKEIDAFTNSKILRTSVINSMSLQSTQDGVLNKWYDPENGIFYKTGEVRYGEYSYVEPVVECICSEIGKAMGVNVVEYELHKSHTKGNEDIIEQDFVLCSSKNIVTPPYISYTTMSNLLAEINVTSYDNLYETLLNSFVFIEEDLNKMIIFDFVINNEDRHLNNFGLLFHGEGFSFAPLFDNERSLLRQMDSSKLDKFLAGKLYNKQIDKCKPFASHHFTQIGYISSTCNLNLDIDVDKIFDKYQIFFSEKRLQCMKKLVKERLDYVRELSTKR